MTSEYVNSFDMVGVSCSLISLFENCRRKGREGSMRMLNDQREGLKRITRITGRRRDVVCVTLGRVESFNTSSDKSPVDRFRH